MQRQLLRQPPRPLRSALREYIVERVQPLPRFQDFNTVRLLRLSHSDLTIKNAILHHKQLGRILLGCKQLCVRSAENMCVTKTGAPRHTNAVESAFSLLKRGIIGSWHKISAKHLPRSG